MRNGLWLHPYFSRLGIAQAEIGSALAISNFSTFNFGAFNYMD